MFNVIGNISDLVYFPLMILKSQLSHQMDAFVILTPQPNIYSFPPMSGLDLPTLSLYIQLGS